MREDVYLKLNVNKAKLFLSPLYPTLMFIPNMSKSRDSSLKQSLSLKLTKEGGEIIEKMYEPMKVGQMIEFFSKKYSDSEERVKENIFNFLNQLRSYGLSTISYEKKDAIIDDKLEKLGSWNYVVPRGMVVEITSKCNFRCKHCYNKSGEGEHLTDIDKEDAFSLIDQMFALGTRTLEITGGEPSIHPYFNEIIEKALNEDFELIGILSNGSNFTEKTFDVLSRNKDKAVAQVDLHGSTPKYVNWFTGHKNAYELALNTIKKLVNIGIPVRLACSVTPGNVNQVEEVANIAYKIGVTAVAFGPVTPVGRAKDNDDLILSYNEDAFNAFVNTLNKLKNKFGPSFIAVLDEATSHDINCGIGSTGLVVSSKLDVRLCQMGDIIIGNLKDYKNNLKDFLINKTKLLENISKTPAPREDICGDCEDLWFCSRCIARGFIKAREKGENCRWYQKTKEHLSLLDF
ncbi:radical SAM/SPASM domain-containing protein [Petrotoga sp. DB-2]